MTPRPVILSPEAEDQVDEIYRYIAQKSGERRAEAFVGKMLAYCRGFAVFPERGTRRDNLRPGIRIIGFRRRVAIAFAVQHERVVIHGLFYGGQDYEAALRGREP